jgi:hypothetical protein
VAGLAIRTGISPETKYQESLAEGELGRSNQSIMKISKMAVLFASLLGPSLGPLCLTSRAQQEKIFDWRPANDESVRLDPAYYHSARTYHPGPNGGNIHVDVSAQRPVTIFLVDAEAWNFALQRPETIVNLAQLCTREHVVEATYVCDLPPAAMTLVIRDERNNPDEAVFAGLGAVLSGNDKLDRAIGTSVATVFTGSGSASRRFFAPNDVHVQYYSYVCVENCIQPEYQWTSQIKEKYELSSFLKVYGGFVPDHDKAQVSIKIKSPVPMIVAMLPSEVADKLHSNPDALETALEKHSCQQRGVQKLEFQCTFDIADGPQSLLVTPEASSNAPHKKAEVQMLAVKCVANCQLIMQNGRSRDIAGMPKRD